ncbi:DUF3489 domain-containing protein [Methyloceanibacter sp.]|uniref:DUF3489 domain-containing protein n=1 Tax=Methyloceanibacter sp. TaxID=1965321 RepID=UPI002BF4D05A|nr:DUF3489 domain-containing protein [Methyloceanibacter sp.]HML90820.1 DUF3489 domain-containing protein [Methyloceanibacter sp.]
MLESTKRTLALHGPKSTEGQGDRTRTPWEATKQQVVVATPRGKAGTALAEIVEKTGWQAYSARGFLPCFVKKRLELSLVTCVSDDGACRYRIAPLSLRGQVATQANGEVCRNASTDTKVQLH